MLRRLIYHKKIITHPDVAINQQNKWGESPLLYYLLSRNWRQITYPFIVALENMLKAGADPHIPDKRGMSALDRVKYLKNERINSVFYDIIKENQAQK